MTPVITVLIADDHPIFRTGLRQVIEADAAIHVVAEAANGDEALARIESVRPDVSVLDIDMPGRDGLEVVRALRDRQSATRVVFLTLHKDAVILNEALDAGVHGYVLKDSAATEIAAAIRSVHAGQQYVSPVLSSLLINRSQRAEALAKEVPGLGALTPAEMKVLKLLAEIKTTKETADTLCLSPRTVEHHRTSIAAKLELRGSLALTRFAVKHLSALKDG